MSSVVSYRIDASNLITSVSSSFGEFAASNGAPKLADAVVGQDLFDSVSGDEVRMLWRMLIDRARSVGSISVPYRCDSPAERRELTMSLRALPGGAVEFLSIPVAVTARSQIQFSGLPGYTSDPMITVCSWCCRFEVGAWVEAEEAVEQLGLLVRSPSQMTHAACPTCVSLILGATGEPSLNGSKLAAAAARSA